MTPRRGSCLEVQGLGFAPTGTPTGHAGAPADMSLYDSRSRTAKQLLSPGTSLMMQPTGRTDSTSAGGAATGGTYALLALRAKPLRLSDTVLQAMLKQATGRTPAAPSGKAEPSPGGGGTESGSSGVGAGRYGRNGVLVGDVIPDCLQYVQSIRLPSRDVYMLLNGGGGGGRKASLLGAGLPSMYDSPANSIARGPSRDLAGAAAAAAAGLLRTVGDLATATGITGCASAASGTGSAVKSLLLLGISTEEGESLALYVSFPVMLPQPILEAVRDSCVDMVDAVGDSAGCKAAASTTCK
jgi:hypothetical protein